MEQKVKAAAVNLEFIRGKIEGLLMAMEAESAVDLVPDLRDCFSALVDLAENGAGGIAKPRIDHAGENNPNYKVVDLSLIPKIDYSKCDTLGERFRTAARFFGVSATTLAKRLGLSTTSGAKLGKGGEPGREMAEKLVEAGFPAERLEFYGRRVGKGRRGRKIEVDFARLRDFDFSRCSKLVEAVVLAAEFFGCAPATMIHKAGYSGGWAHVAAHGFTETMIERLRKANFPARLLDAELEKINSSPRKGTGRKVKPPVEKVDDVPDEEWIENLRKNSAARKRRAAALRGT